MRSRRSIRLASRFASYAVAVTPSMPVAPSLRVSSYAFCIHSRSMTWCSEVSTSPGLRLASSAIHRRFVDRFVGLMSLPMFPVDGSLLATPSFPPSGPGEPGSPLSAALCRRYDFPSACPWPLIGSLPLPTGTSWFVFAAALPEGRRSSSRPGLLVSRCPICPARSTWTRLGPLRSSGDPFLCLCSAPGPPRSNQRALAIPVTSMLPPLVGRRRLRQSLISGLTRSFGTHCHTLHADVAAHVQGLLPAGRLGLCRVGVEPTGSLRVVSARIDDHPPLLLS